MKIAIESGRDREMRSLRKRIEQLETSLGQVQKEVQDLKEEYKRARAR
jgi:prefoldin subunit 5